MKNEKQAREFLRADFTDNKGLEVNGTYYKDLESLRSNDRIAYRDLIDVIVWADRIDYDLRVHPERLQSKKTGRGC